MPINESTTPCVAESDAINHCKALFLEADRLTDQAYSILDEPFCAQTMLKFSIAKKCADEKYRQAWQAWLLARERAH
ncbi:hypothetical protein [Pseudomonas sp. KCJK9016]|uniref:hypothetical protein n=1 Tax=Pseudomonas sp. KCJK9016 TaxID=3344556 RepID=UPI00390577CA